MIRNQELLSKNKIDLKPLIDGPERNVKLVEGLTTDVVTYIGKVVIALKDIGSKLRAGDIAKSSEMFTDVLEGIDWIAQLVMIIKDRYGENFSRLACNGSTAAELENDLLNILTELIPVHIRKDWTMMADLLE
ncbi:MAG: hypothetical protein JXA66_08370, partial [Oligoflexia bacterium]|nr:hypothetical protein [Oligoflexia bacterium]